MRRRVRRPIRPRRTRSSVRLALEVVNRYETSMLPTTVRGLAFLDRVAHEIVWLHLDMFHMSLEEAAPFDVLKQALPRLAYFELDQSHRGAIVDGSLDLIEWAKETCSAGYAGTVGVEVFSRALMTLKHANALAIWEDRFTEGEKIAAEFMRVIDADFADRG